MGLFGVMTCVMTAATHPGLSKTGSEPLDFSTTRNNKADSIQNAVDLWDEVRDTIRHGAHFDDTEGQN